MDKLKQVISQFDRWRPLVEYVNRIEGYRDSDFPFCIENAKSLLESIAKEICTNRGQQFHVDDSTGKILKLAFGSLGYSCSTTIQQVGGAIAHIGHQMSVLRNEIGDTAHGRPLEELENRKVAIDKASADFLLSSTELVCCFLIQLFEGELETKYGEIAGLDFDDNSEFNEFWDDQYGEFVTGEYTFPASEVLFKLDPLAYRSECNAFKVGLHENDAT